LPDIAPELVGKSQSDVNEILQSKAEIDKVEITLAPPGKKTSLFLPVRLRSLLARNKDYKLTFYLSHIMA